MNAVLSPETVRERLTKIARGGCCLACGTAANTLAEVQDLLEDAGVSPEALAEAVNSKLNERHGGQKAGNQYMSVARGRLRFADRLSDERYACLSVINLFDYIEPLMRQQTPTS